MFNDKIICYENDSNNCNDCRYERDCQYSDTSLPVISKKPCHRMRMVCRGKLEELNPEVQAAVKALL